MTTVDGKFKLWFFQALTYEQRTRLFSLYGMPVEGITTHGGQSLALAYLAPQLVTAPEAKSEVGEDEITTLRKELAEARALLTVIGKTFAGMEDGDGNEAPELVLIREFTAKTMADILAKQAAHPVLRPPSKAKGEKK